MTNHLTKKESKEATGTDSYNLASKRDFVALTTDVEKLDINKFVNTTTGWNTLKTNVDDLDVDNLKTVLVGLKKSSDVMSKEVVKCAVYNKLISKVNSLENEYIADATTLINIHQEHSA